MSPVLDAWFSMLDAGCWMLDEERKLMGFKKIMG